MSIFEFMLLLNKISFKMCFVGPVFGNTVLHDFDKKWQKAIPLSLSQPISPFALVVNFDTEKKNTF
jgi:hypothetical protein